MIDRNDPRYVKAVIEQWPKPEDPKEQMIVSKIKRELFSTEWAKYTFDRLRRMQVYHMKDLLSHLQDPQYIHDRTQELLVQIAEVVNSKIVEGEKNIDSLHKEKGLLIATNHLGSYKLNSLNPVELRGMGIDGPTLPIYYPFPLYFASMSPVAEKLECNLYEASFEYPGRIGEIYGATGSIEVPPPIQNESGEKLKRTEILINSTKLLLNKHPNAAIVSFPEGGTTGKRNGKGPYDMEPFRSGSFVIAAEAGIPVLPVAQYFNPDRGFELNVFSPVFPEAGKSEEYYKEIAKISSDQMQIWLDKCIGRKVA